MTPKTIPDDLVSEWNSKGFAEPATPVYNPLICASKAWDLTRDRLGKGTRKVALPEMNPVPFVMTMTHPWSAS